MPGLVCVPGLSTPAPGLTADCQTINPISRLIQVPSLASLGQINNCIQIQQAKKEKEPVYSLIAERGMPRRREFVMQVGANNIKTKLSKR